jgi:hypothetical protein
MAAETRLEVPQGTLDLLILKTVAVGPQHGWAISERLRKSPPYGDVPHHLGCEHVIRHA